MSTNNKPLTKEERNHLAHHYWEDLNHWQGPANTWNCENGIFDYDLFPFIRAWLLETRTFTVTKPKEPWYHPKDGEGYIQSEKRDFGRMGFWEGILSKLHPQAKMIEGGVESSHTKVSAKGSVQRQSRDQRTPTARRVIWAQCVCKNPVRVISLGYGTEHNGSNYFIWPISPVGPCLKVLQSQGRGSNAVLCSGSYQRQFDRAFALEPGKEVIVNS